jgi:hypothetical protein
MISGNPIYRTEDLPIPATFTSVHKSHTFYLIPIEEEIGPDNTIRRKRDTGCRVRFEDYRLVVRNTEVLKMLLKHTHFNNLNFGFKIDEEDPSGFWRAQGIVKEKTITTFVPQSEYAVTFESLDLKKKPPVKLRPLVRIEDGQQALVSVGADGGVRQEES